MIKKLAIRKDIPVKGRCWDTIRLAPIMSNEKYMPWFLDKFNTLFMEGNFEINSYYHKGFERIQIYSEVLEYKNFVDYTSDNLISRFIEEIDKGNYFIVVWDHYFLSNSKRYNKVHTIHDTLIYGYDSDKEEFYFIDVAINDDLNTESTVTFEDFKKAFYSGLKIMKENYENSNSNLIINNGPVSTFSLRDINREIDYGKILFSFRETLDGRELIDNTLKEKGVRYHNIKTGIAVYKGVYDGLYNYLIEEDKEYLSKRPLVLFGLKYFAEIKYSLLLKLSYLQKNSFMNIDDSIFEEVNALCNELLIGFQLMMKYSFTQSVNDLTKARKHYINAEAMDIELLTKLKNLFVKKINENIFKIGM